MDTARAVAKLEELPDTSAAPVLKLLGELDLSTVPLIRDELQAVLDRGPDTIVFDLSELQFMDSSGITLLVSVAQRAEVELRNPQPIVRRVLELTGLLEVFHLNS